MQEVGGVLTHILVPIPVMIYSLAAYTLRDEGIATAERRRLGARGGVPDKGFTEKILVYPCLADPFLLVALEGIVRLQT